MNPTHLPFKKGNIDFDLLFSNPIEYPTLQCDIFLNKWIWQSDSFSKFLSLALFDNHTIDGGVHVGEAFLSYFLHSLLVPSSPPPPKKCCFSQLLINESPKGSSIVVAVVVAGIFCLFVIFLPPPSMRKKGCKMQHL